MNLSSNKIAVCLLVVVVLFGAVYVYYYMQNNSLENENTNNTHQNDNDNQNMESEEVAMEEALEATEGYENHVRRSAEDFENQDYEQYQNHQGHQGHQGHPQEQQEYENFQNQNGLGGQETGDYMQLPSECYPKDVLTSSDLLPRNANSLHAQVVPSGQGALSDQNFLTAGFHTGINTVGQSLKNANLQLRSEPPNPQVKVSIWNQSTIEPDTNRRPLEIGGH
jgi:cell division protein FtsL